MTTTDFGDEYSWSLGTCSGNQAYGDNMEYTEECCLNAGVYTLKCKDSNNNGWDNGFIDIQGTKYCENFNNGREEAVEVTVVAGKYGLARFECLPLLLKVFDA